jgi:ABC-type uncharacterized transport system involved in gliding motility auxiliary subunit
MVIDKMSRVMGGDFLLPMVANYGSHVITQDFELTSLFSVARSVEKEAKIPDGVNVTPLAFTSQHSWSETNKQSIDAGAVNLDKEDRKGPICLSVISEIESDSTSTSESKNNEKVVNLKTPDKGKLLVFGDADFACNRLIDLVGNNDFITNSINFLIGRGELITIRKEKRPIEPLSLSRSQGQVLFWIPVVVTPLFVLIIGVFVWLKRRSH